MKKIVEKSSYIDRAVGTVTIDAVKLIEILRKFSKDEKITARSNGYAFSSLDDISENMATFAGNPKITLGEIDIGFENGKCKVSNGWRGDAAEEKVAAFVNEISAYRGLFDKWRDFIIHISLTAATVYIAFFAFQHWPIEGAAMFSLGYEFVFAVAICWFVQSAVFLSKRQSVRYRVKEPFWQRHQETIVTGVVGPILGAAVTYWLTKQ